MPDLGPPQPYEWTDNAKRFARLYIWTPWPSLTCGNAKDALVMAQTPAGGPTIFYETTYYGEHAREHLEQAFGLFILQAHIQVSRCHPMYHPDGAWWPRDDCAPFRYWPDSTELKVVSRTKDMTHFDYADPQFYAANPSFAAPTEDLYLWGPASHPSALMACDRPVDSSVFASGSGRMCRAAFSHEGFVTVFRFSQIYVPADQARRICAAYLRLLGSMEGKGSEASDWNCTEG